MNEYIGDSGKELEGAAEQIVESYMGEYMQVVHFFTFDFPNRNNNFSGQPGVYEGLVSRLLCQDRPILRPGSVEIKLNQQTKTLIAQVEMDHGTKDPKTGDELTYEVTLSQGVEDKDEEEKEDTVFSEEEQRLVKESVQRMHERLSSKRKHRPSIKKTRSRRQRNQHNVEEDEGHLGESQARRGINGIRRVGLPLENQGYRPIINQVLLD